MNALTGWLVAAAFLVLSVGVIYSAIKARREYAEKNENLEKELRKQKFITAELYRHAQEIAKIEEDDKATAQKINEARSDEEIVDIINSIISSNNERVRK